MKEKCFLLTKYCLKKNIFKNRVVNISFNSTRDLLSYVIKSSREESLVTSACHLSLVADGDRQTPDMEGRCGLVNKESRAVSKGWSSVFKVRREVTTVNVKTLLICVTNCLELESLARSKHREMGLRL
jgi:hypothetical protein